MLGLDVLGCWVDSFDLIVIRVQWQHVRGIARYSVSLQGGMCKIGSWGTANVNAIHEYSQSIFPAVLIDLFFPVGLGKGGNCVWDGGSLDRCRVNNVALVDCNYLLDVETLHLVVEFFADVQKFSPDSVDVAVVETVKVVHGFELSRPQPRLQILPLLHDCNVKEKLVEVYFVWWLRQGWPRWCC